MIIFGWGHQTTKNYGITFKNHCSHCNNDDYWQLVRMTTWFTLFFIPIIPYENKYLLICPVCEYGIKLDSSKANELKPLAEANTDLIEQRITEIEYQNRVRYYLTPGSKKDKDNIIEGDVFNKEDKKDNDKKTKKETKFCSNCGHKLEKDSKFCPGCGIEII